MKFFLDHDVPAEVARVLRQEAHEVIELRQVMPVHANDCEALAYASDHGLFLITCNRDDFLVLAADRPNPGMIMLVRRRSRHAECANLLALLTRSSSRPIRVFSSQKLGNLTSKRSIELSPQLYELFSRGTDQK